ncbi:16S rRNA (cytidine(1402)-2'-O)-methyltransferase [Candidatus Poribacteria bacterium]|nr:16S rRNA (cytidine(1402)-2'-O)-methyltransferase [Candidatus Poribacteria bacterium]
MQEKSGILYIVSTPIGNLEDITLRAIRILKEVDVIASEDTRHTGILLAHYGIETPTTSFYSYNQKSKVHYLLDLLNSGKNIALVSDAGTPGISDPGYEIIHRCVAEHISIIPIPGTTALIASLVISGFHTNKFIFEGFLSSKTQTRRQELLRLKDEIRTLIFYESPHRIKKFLLDAYEIFGDRNIVLARELTKKFEEILRGKISEIINSLPENIKGEFSVIIEGEKENFLKKILLSDIQIKEEVEKIMSEENISKNEAIKSLSQLTNISRNDIYKACINK